MNKDFENKLISKGIRPTAMRLLVLKFLHCQTRALSINAMVAGMNYPDKVTMYRTIKTFMDAGLVLNINEGTGPAKFALSVSDEEPGGQDDLHVHFFCNSCGETTRLPKTNAPELSLPAEFQPEKVNMMVKGVCNKCSKRLFNNQDGNQ